MKRHIPMELLLCCLLALFLLAPSVEAARMTLPPRPMSAGVHPATATSLWTYALDPLPGQTMVATFGTDQRHQGHFNATALPAGASVDAAKDKASIAAAAASASAASSSSQSSSLLSLSSSSSAALLAKHEMKMVEKDILSLTGNDKAPQAPKAIVRPLGGFIQGGASVIDDEQTKRFQQNVKAAPAKTEHVTTGPTAAANSEFAAMTAAPTHPPASVSRFSFAAFLEMTRSKGLAIMPIVYVLFIALALYISTVAVYTVASAMKQNSHSEFEHGCYVPVDIKFEDVIMRRERFSGLTKQMTAESYAAMLRSKVAETILSYSRDPKDAAVVAAAQAISLDSHAAMVRARLAESMLSYKCEPTDAALLDAAAAIRAHKARASSCRGCTHEGEGCEAEGVLPWGQTWMRNIHKTGHFMLTPFNVISQMLKKETLFAAEP